MRDGKKRLCGGWLLAALPFFAGCGVSKEVHTTVLQDLASLESQLESTRGELSESRAREEALNRQVEVLRQQLTEREAELEARAVELRTLRQQNLDLINLRENQAAEIEGLQAGLARLKAALGRAEAEVNRTQAAADQAVEQLKQTYDSLVGELKDEIEQGKIKVSQALDQLSVSMVEQILFDSGSADIKPEGRAVLARLGKILKDVTDKQIRIEGHTDDVPIGSRLTSKFPSNWELSALRATNVVKFLSSEVGVDPFRLSASGYSMYRPVASNETQEGRASNRRIEIKLLPADPAQVLKKLR